MVVTWYGTDSPHLSRKCAQVSGKAGENGQTSGRRGGTLILDKTVGSRVWWHSEGLGRAPARSWVEIRVFILALGSLLTGSPAGRAPLLNERRECSMYSQA